jgi:hypothetical protein
MLVTLSIVGCILAQNQFQRRFYFADSQCRSDVSLSVGVFIAGSRCALEGGYVCEAKSTGVLPSSESTGCETVSSFSLAPYFNASFAPTQPASYLTLNQFYTNDCSYANSFEQNIFLADGKVKSN